MFCIEWVTAQPMYGYINGKRLVIDKREDKELVKDTERAFALRIPTTIIYDKFLTKNKNSCKRFTV